MTAHLCISTYKTPGNDALKLELCFVGQDCVRVPVILGATYGCQTRRLDLSFNSLSSLDGLERFPYLEELILDNNSLTSDARWPALPLLHTLSLNKNQLSDLLPLLEKLRSSCPQLRYLSLLNNCASPDQLSNDCDEQEYRTHRLVVLQYLPKLMFLDSTKVRQSEVRKAKEMRGRSRQSTKCNTLMSRPEDLVSRDSSCSPLFRNLPLGAVF